MFDNIHNESPYQGYPDDTKDALWEGLYGSEQARIVFRTIFDLI